MITAIEIVAGVLAALVAIAFGFLFYIKINAYDVHNPWQYKSRHAPDTVREVPRTYIPRGVRVFREMWRARIEGTPGSYFLRMPIYQFDELHQKRLIEQLSNWAWVDVPSNQWPLLWQYEAGV